MLRTHRLLLRPFLPADAAELYHLNADTEVMRFLPRYEVFTSVNEAKEFLRTYLESTRLLPYARWAVLRTSDDAWLGWCGLKLHENGETDLGFRFHRRYWGQGFATESSWEWLRWAREEAGLKRLVAQAATGNLGSQRVLTKLGFTREPAEDYEEDGFLWCRYGLTLLTEGEHKL